MKKKILLIMSMFCLLLLTSRVHALSSDIAATEFGGVIYNNYQYPIARYIEGNSTGSYVVKVWSNINKPYFVLDVCTWASMNFSIYNGDYSGTYFNDISYTINTGLNCSYENNTGTLYKVYLSCDLFDISGGSDGAGLCNSGWRFTNTSSYGSYFVIQDLNVFSEPQYDNDKRYYDQIFAQSSQNQAIIEQNKETNNKLDNLQGAINDGNKETQDVIKDQFNSCRDSKNLLPNTFTSQTLNGVTITVNKDKSIRFVGTPTAGFDVYLARDLPNLEEGVTYTLSSSATLPKGTYLRIRNNTSYDVFYTLGKTDNVDSSSLTFTYDNRFTSGSYSAYIWFGSYSVGTPVDFTIYPQLEKGSSKSKYEPYGEEICTNKIDDTNEKLDDIYNSDISDSDKELPNDDNYKDYSNVEGELKDKVNQADLSQISIGIDSKSSSWIWDTLTSFIQSNSIVFGMFIAILSIGVIKLALGR